MDRPLVKSLAKSLAFLLLPARRRRKGKRPVVTWTLLQCPEALSCV